MLVFGKVTSTTVEVKAVQHEGGMAALQLAFDPAAMGLEHCPSCGKLVEQAEVHHFGECMTCFRASLG